MKIRLKGFYCRKTSGILLCNVHIATSAGDLFQHLSTLNTKKHVPYIRSNSRLFWFETVSPCPLTTDLSKEPIPFLLMAHL